MSGVFILELEVYEKEFKKNDWEKLTFIYSKLTVFEPYTKLPDKESHTSCIHSYGERMEN